MGKLKIGNITGIPPYSIYISDQYGDNKTFIATINTNVPPEFYTIDVGNFPLFNSEILSASNLGITNAISDQISTATELNVTLIVNTTIIDCITMNISGTYTFSPIVNISSSDNVSIILANNACLKNKICQN